MTSTLPHTTTPAATPAAPPTPGGARAGLLLLSLTFACMSLIFPPFNVWPLAFVAVVPFTVVVLRRRATGRWVLAYYGLGCAFFLINLHWIFPVTVGGWFALSLYVALYWPLYAVGLRALVARGNWPATLAVPLVWVATEYLRVTVMSGLSWFFLGGALVECRTLLQAADLLGVEGLSFFVAMGSGLIVDLLRLPLAKKGRWNRKLAAAVVGYLALCLALVLYGRYRIAQTPRVTTPGPLVAVVQQAIPQKQKDSGSPEDEEANFKRHYDLSQNVIAQHPDVDLIAWPETMVPGYLNRQWLDMTPEGYDRVAEVFRDSFIAFVQRAKVYDRRIRELSNRSGASMVVGAPAFFFTGPNPRNWIDQNDAFYYRPGVGQIQPPYAKRHLVPFGEYVPFRQSAPLLYKALLKLVPEGFGTADPGDAWTHYHLHARDGKTYTFGVPICYEDTAMEPCWQFVRPVDGKKGADFLLSISNDGWFVSPSEFRQHLMMTRVRAVENRVPFARSVNGGDSGIVDSTGHVTLVNQDRGMSPEFTGGVLAGRLAVDSRVSLYSRLGDGFPVGCVLISAAAGAVVWVTGRIRQRTV